MRPNSFQARIVLGLFLLLTIAVVQLQAIGVDAAEDDTGRSVEGEALPQQTADEDYDPEANLPYLFAVFMVTWAGLFGFVFVMTRRRREMQSELNTLRKAISEQDKSREPHRSGPNE